MASSSCCNRRATWRAAPDYSMGERSPINSLLRSLSPPLPSPCPRLLLSLVNHCPASLYSTSLNRRSPMAISPIALLAALRDPEHVSWIAVRYRVIVAAPRHKVWVAHAPTRRLSRVLSPANHVFRPARFVGDEACPARAHEVSPARGFLHCLLARYPVSGLAETSFSARSWKYCVS